MAGVDTTTRYEGIFARHREGCVAERDRARCDCIPSYFGTAWDKQANRTRKTKHFRLVSEARPAREDLQKRIRAGKILQKKKRILVREARDRFLKDARKGIALNKRRRPYRPKAVENLEHCLVHIPEPMLEKHADAVMRGEVQALVDDLQTRLSASRVSNIVNSIRAMYRWALERELATDDPAHEIRLPASDEKPRDRVATPSEFARLLQAILEPTPAELEASQERNRREALKDALPLALAGYGTARLQEVQVLDWEHIDMETRSGELAADEQGRKPGGSWRVVPFVEPLWFLLQEEWIAQGRPSSGKVCPPRAKRKTGLLSVGNLMKRLKKRWEAMGLKPIGLHEARHTSATWLDHAGVSPKVSSEIIGHKTPEYQPGAPRITQDRYTHVLPGELERARALLEKFLADRLPEEPTEVPWRKL